MASRCQNCNQVVNQPLPVDVPEGIVLCAACHGDLVWRCESVGGTSPIPGFTAVKYRELIIWNQLIGARNVARKRWLLVIAVSKMIW